MRVWTAPVTELTFDDVKLFVDQKIRENYQVEYKEDWPSQSLAKWLCAFANADGGLIVLGVADDGTGRPAAITGMPADQAKEDSVDAAAWMVTPPLFRLVECSRPIPVPNAPDKAVLVIRVKPGLSDMPYNVNGVVYIRTDGSKRDVQDLASKRVAVANPEEFIRLLRSREESVRIRKDLLKGGERYGYRQGFTILICPEFPSDPSTWPSLAGFHEMATRKAVLFTGAEEFPFDSRWEEKAKRVPRGVLHDLRDQGEQLLAERWGLILYQAWNEWGGFCTDEQSEKPFFHLGVLGRRACLVSSYAARVYREMGFFRRLLVHVAAGEFNDIPCRLTGRPFHRESQAVLHGSVGAQISVDAAQLIDDPIESLHPLFQELLYVPNIEAAALLNLVKKDFRLSKDGVSLFENGQWTGNWRR